MASLFNIFIGLLMITLAIIGIFFLLSYDKKECVDANIPPPTSITSKVSGISVILTWTPATGVDGYNIYQSNDENFKISSDNLVISLTGQNENSYTVSNLIPGQVYYFLIASFKGKCIGSSAPNSPIKTGISFTNIAISPVLSESCGALVKSLIGATNRACPYSYDSIDNKNNNGGNQIGFYYDTNVTPNKQFNLTSDGNIVTSSNPNICVYYNTDFTHGKDKNVICYTDCSKIPDQYKKWQVGSAGNNTSHFYVKLQQSDYYLTTDADVFADYVQGPYMLPQKPSLDCKTLPFWQIYTPN